MDVYLAIDLGAGSGRVMSVLHDAGTITLEHVHRFESPAIEQQGSLLWDLHLIWNEIKIGLCKAAQKYGHAIVSLGVDSWGVDYAWFDKQGELVQLPHCYRDPRTQGLVEEVGALIGREIIFEETGIQFMPINTLYQLSADGRILDDGRRFLMIADVINYWLSGRMGCERTNASTTQLYNPRSRTWSSTIADRIGIPPTALPPLVDPGETLGILDKDVADETGLEEIPVIAIGSHDTASAVAGVPATTESFAYLSCGTWALLGTEIGEPMISDTVLEHNFTNETGVENTFRLLKNISGLWIIQECRRVWQETDGAAITFKVLAELTETASPFAAFIDPDDAMFSNRGNHPEAIKNFCERSRQTVPTSRGEILRVATESLALKVAITLNQLEGLLGRTLNVIHVIGGGVNNQLLMQGIANATQRRVIAGPTEATALGNALVQMISSRAIESLASGRALLSQSVQTTAYEPNDSWDNARQRFQTMLENGPI